eukprot:445139-Rhodomonas_salina.1
MSANDLNPSPVLAPPAPETDASPEPAPEAKKIKLTKQGLPYKTNKEKKANQRARESRKAEEKKREDAELLTEKEELQKQVAQQANSLTAQAGLLTSAN